MSIHNAPALILGLLVGAYWARVLRMAIKSRRKAGTSAHLIPPEPLGRVLRILWYPAVALWVGVPIYIGLVAPDRLPQLSRPLFAIRAIAWLAAATGTVAFVATLICWRKMGKAWRMGIDPNEKNPLVVTGPWAYVRHPIYALSSALMLSTFVAVPAPLMLAAGIIHLALLQWEARREERHLLSVYPDTYGTYMRQTGRFVPRLTGSRPAP